MFDLANAVDRFSRLVSRLHERGDIRNIHSEGLNWRVLDLLHAFERGPEGAPEHVSAVLAITNGSEP
jgi:hypothetical protein